MKIGYIKLDKPKEGKLNKIKYNIKKFFNCVWKDKYNKENYYLCRINNNSKNKLINMLLRDGINYTVQEKGLDINYNTLNGKFTLKYMLPEIVKYCFKLIHPKIEEVFVCANKYSEENVKIIKELSLYVKVVNIISDNSRYLILEKELESNDIYITVNNNKRKSMKRANILINLDFRDIDEYNINRNMIVIDITNNMYLSKGFDGIYIKSTKVDTEKIKRVFSEYENFERDELIESEMVKIGEYNQVRNYVKMNKFTISKVIGKRMIDVEEFKRLEKMVS